MESLWKLLYLLEPAPMTLIVTAMAVTFGSAFRALNHGKEMERNRDLLEASITLDRSQAPMIPAIPAMLLALVLCFDHRNSRDTVNLLDLHSLKGNKYIWYALPGYAIGLVTALAAGILTHSPQPALLYLVPSTLGPIFFISWLRKDLAELWEGTMPNLNDKARQIEL
ncbi:hypothetical protein ES332_D11G010800v1 [Gossypium tomentosum]|uniref:Uncharacterized protein n=1 Tax=Gossypium tomentosum TaxID=34277 RepID=A0A5D2IGG8_GOSTO|nr:hypothetical protein ES332_D11G010800v1 [Gossypium tomentosum]TYH41690.1 hypothetical protein ES332_D11G010800v1 [Gossypium tomentosum]TYH41691.1 hypothetical protein ES332_D11G010800v1 [Gossypium tomentosum]